MSWLMITSRRCISSARSLSCSSKTRMVSFLADMSATDSPSGRSLVSDELPSTQTYSRPSESFSEVGLPLLTRILTASTEVPRTSAAS